MTPQNQYNNFWEQLSLAYPVSHGELRLPIATKFLDKDFSFQIQISDFQEILDQIFAIIRSESIECIFTENNDDKLISFISGDFTGIVRFDCMVNSRGELRVIEINSDYPDGLILHDWTVSALEQKTSILHAESFLKFFDKTKNIFIAYPDEAFFRDAYYREYELLKDNGFTVFIGNYSYLERRGEELFFEGARIDTIRRCIEVGKMHDEDFAKLSGTRVNFVNTFDMHVFDFKDLLWQIDHPLLPKTENLTDKNAAWVLENRENLVLKPINSYEGIGVNIGVNTTEEDWEKLIVSEKNRDYIAQELVDTQKITMSFYDEGTIVSRDVYYDVCPHFFVKNGKIDSMGHILVRYSENKILNVAMGGGIGYMKNE